MNLIFSSVTESPVGIETPIAEEDDTNEEEPLEQKHLEHGLGNTTDTSEINTMKDIGIDEEDLDSQDAIDSATEDRNQDMFVEDEIDKTVETNEISELIEVKHERIEQSDISGTSNNYNENLNREEDKVEKVL